MPSTIPYDPSLALGNLVDPKALATLEKIGDLQAPADQAEEAMNAQISLKRSLDMTVQEMIDMGIDPSDVIKESQKVGKAVSKAASEYAKAKVDSLNAIAKVKKDGIVHGSLESPIDYNKTQIKSMPLSADSLRLNAQYFSFYENMQDAATIATSVKSFVSESVDWLGDTVKSSQGAAAQSQINSQYSRHSIAGTLVISISCTHKDALLLAPFILDVDKAIRVWNKLHTNDKLNPNNPASLVEVATAQGTEKEKNSMTILSGATYGSSFVAMVHVLNTTTTQSSEVMASVAASMTEQFEVGGWFAKMSGSFGVDSSFSSDIKNLLSTQNIQSHCTITTMGSIPSIKSNEIQMAVEQFAKFDGAESMAKLAALQNATASEKDSVASAAEAARTGNTMMKMESTKITSALEGLAPIQEAANKILDINSVMDAMEDYVNKCLAGNVGVPINYYLKPITKAQLAEMWVNKYFPGKYLALQGDDSGTGSGGGGNSGGG
ncbi:MAG: hypothetical protein AAFQ37_02335, partial [Bacteroidota bacterium]